MRLPYLTLVVAACATRGPSGPEVPTPATLDYPESPRSETTTTYYGTDVADPFDRLEDLDAPETVAWVEAQNALTRSVLDGLPERAHFATRLAELWEFERWGVPNVAGDHVLWTTNDGTQDQSVLVVSDAVDGEPRVLLDPNTWSEDGTVSLAGWVPSDDGAHVAYAIADAGSDWRTWRVVETATGTVLDDELSWTKFTSTSWLPDGSGFFYSRYPAPTSDDFEERLRDQTVWFHRIGTPQSDDIRIYADPSQPDWGYGAWVTKDGELLVITVWEGTEEKSRVYTIALDALDLATPGARLDAPVHKLLDDFDANYILVGKHERTMWFTTTLDAPKSRVIAIDLDHPEREAWTEVLPQTDDTLRGVSWIGDRFVASYLTDARSRMVLHETDGTPVGEVQLPGLGSTASLSGEHDDPIAYVAFTSTTDPGSILRLDTRTAQTEVVRRPQLAFDPDDYVTEQVWFPSADGTQIPMFVSHRRDLDRSAPQPTLLYGYGGFNIAITPRFRVDTLAWMEAGGVYASANLRGGGEYGEAWHLAGTKQSKQNVFDDFIGAAEFLIEQGYTSSSQLGVHGRSNGGLLTGAVLTQRPDLFAATLPAVGVLDMLKYHTWTIGWAWASDYGTWEESEDMFRALLAYSPVHNTVPGTSYPPTLITTADHDDRVVPAHSYKFAAALQDAHAGPAPVIIRIETRAGHGAGTPISMLVEEAADKFGFLAHHTGLVVVP